MAVFTYFIFLKPRPASLTDSNKSSYDSTYVYSLPYEKGRSFTVTQGYQGKMSHQNLNALDFSLYSGTKVCAARGGIAIEVVENNTQHCLSMDCAKLGNRIIIRHEDNTIAEYWHLEYMGALVEVNDTVKQDQHIGYSGNTGYSTGPHLHFSVSKPNSWGVPSTIKTKFKTTAQEPEYLVEHRSYFKNY